MPINTTYAHCDATFCQITLTTCFWLGLRVGIIGSLLIVAVGVDVNNNNNNKRICIAPLGHNFRRAVGLVFWVRDWLLKRELGLVYRVTGKMSLW